MEKAPLSKLETYGPAVFVWAVIAFASFMKTGFGVLRGTLPGNDDYMRLVQIRDWLGGQAWGDPVQSRMFPADPLISHWSRFTDSLIGALIKILTPIFGAQGAETAALMILPPTLLLIAIILVVRLAVKMSDGPWIPLAAALTAGLCFSVFYQFYPGRIDHHGLQIVLALGTAAAIMRSVDRANFALIAGALCGLSLWVGIESAPYVAAACIAVSINWVLRAGDKNRRALMLFGLSMAGITALCLLISPPQSRAIPFCDAISTVFALLTAAIAVAMIIAALIGPKVKSPIARLAVISSLGMAAAGLTIAIYPQCLYGPYAQLDPRLTEVWLSNVSEAKPFHRTFAGNPAISMAMIIVPLFAIIGLYFSRPAGKPIQVILGNTPARTLLIFTVLTALTGLIQTRMFSFSGALGAPLAALFIARMADYADRFKSDLPKALARVSILALLSPLFIPAVIGFAFPVSKIENATADAGAEAQDEGALIIACNEPAALRAMRAYPTGLVITQIDLGAPTLAATSHSVTSAPYHRNEKGLLATLDIYMGTPDAAGRVVQSLGADYLIACDDFSETDLLTRMAPDGLLADLKAGKTPIWLTRLDLPVLANGQDNPVTAYKVIKP